MESYTIDDRIHIASAMLSQAKNIGKDFSVAYYLTRFREIDDPLGIMKRILAYAQLGYQTHRPLGMRGLNRMAFDSIIQSLQDYISTQQRIKKKLSGGEIELDV